MKLRFESGERKGQLVEVVGDDFSIGRGNDCDLVLADDDVSRRHVRIQRLPDDEYFLEDLGSTNGTDVDGNPLAGRIALRGNERIRLGDTVLVAQLDGDERAGDTHVSPGSEDRDKTVVGAPLPRRRRPPARDRPPPPRQDSAIRRSASRIQSRVERVRLRRHANRALLLAGAALAIAIAAVVLAVTGVLGGDDQPTVEAVVARVAPSTALVVTSQDGRGLGTGSAWILDAREGLVVTNHHVINGGERFQVGLNGEMQRATVVGSAPCEDLAVLQIDNREGLRALPLGSQGELRQGRTVIAVGYPASASARSNLSSTVGVVSVTRSAFDVEGRDVPRYSNVIQTDAAINPGNSGGPLVDLEGRLVGVNSAGLDFLGGRTIQGQGYAFGVDRVKEIVPQLRRGRSLAWSGLGLEFPDPDQLRRARLPAGLLAVGAAPGSPAARAGLDQGRSLLLAVDGRRVGSTLRGYCRAVRDAGATARFTLLDLVGDRGLRTVRLGLR